MHLYRRYYPDEGGIESTMRAFCEYAAGLGNDVTALVSSPYPWSQRAHYNGVDVVRAGCLGTLANTPICPMMPLWVRRLKPDLIEIHHAYPYGMWALLHSGFKGPVIVHYHFDISRFGSLQRYVYPVLRDTLARADRIFVNSRGYAESSSLLSDFLDKCVFIPAGVAPARFDLPRILRSARPHCAATDASARSSWGDCRTTRVSRTSSRRCSMSRAN